MKQMLADRVDAVKYVQLNGKGKYQYTRELITTIDEEMKKKRQSYLHEKVLLKGTRKFDLIDLTIC